MGSDMATVASPAPVVCTIAGSDSSGSSGIQADLATFAALGVHGTTVLTVVTAQDTIGVSGFFELDPALVAAQLDAVVGDLAPRATKTGLLRSVEVVDIVLTAAAQGRLGLLVVDPVLVDSAGRGIVADGVIDRCRRLGAHATALTPNRWEAELLIDTPLPDTDAVIAAAPRLRELGAPLIVVTGGRSDDDVVVDVVVTADGIGLVEAPRVGDEPIRGTGCTYAAAMTAWLAHGRGPEAAAQAASAFVDRQLAKAHDLRKGAGRPGVPHRCDAPPAVPEHVRRLGEQTE
jgi:hydroxymethylpyrimidine/phosphomethylpyrimidine kinase